MIIDSACSGSLNDVNGTLVADFFPSADTGLLTTDGIFFPEGTMPLRWVADQKNAYMSSSGIGYVFRTSRLVPVENRSDLCSIKTLPRVDSPVRVRDSPFST